MIRFSKLIVPALIVILILSFNRQEAQSWIRINQLGYTPNSVKVAVWCSKENKALKTFQLINAATKKIAFSGSAGKAFGAYGPFTETYRLNFSSFKKPGVIICKQVVQNLLSFKLVKMFIMALQIFVCGICASNAPASILF